MTTFARRAMHLRIIDIIHINSMLGGNDGLLKLFAFVLMKWLKFIL